MTRTYVVTGSASGIGAATARRLSTDKSLVITCDIHDADVLVDLRTKDGRARLVEQVNDRSGGVVDGVAAVAGVGRPDGSTVSVNFFGAVEVLEGLRPALERSANPRAVAVSSLVSIMGADPRIVDCCMAGDEPDATAAADAAARGGQGAIIYPSTKAALNRWVRRQAPTPLWAGAGIPLNAVAPGVIATPGAAPILSDPAALEQMRARITQPLGFPGNAGSVAAVIDWLIGPDNDFITGQVIFVDGGAETVLRGELPFSV